ncbi:MAG: hypothetical protein HQL96_04415 [Magnetococcales bacterium]|nr:hypothetical protein [Magnetococcales bacterium]
MPRWLLSLTLVGWMGIPSAVLADAGSSAGVGSLIGPFVGGLLGHASGNEREKESYLVIHNALEYGPSQTEVTWVNPDNRVSYMVTPQPARMVQGRICREVNIQAILDGNQETFAGLTCRYDNGQWRLVDRYLPPGQVVVPRPATRYMVPVPVYPAPGVVIYESLGPRHDYRNYPRWNRNWGHDWRYRY